VVSVKYARPPNDKTSDLYKQAAEAEATKDITRAAAIVAEIVQIDPADFIAWAKLGSLHAAQNSLAKADVAVRKSLELRPDYTPALLNLGMILAVQKEFESAIELFKRAIASDPNTAIAHRMLGEAYLQVRKGSLGLEALNAALRLDPTGMAECHLLIARLYDLAGARNLAAREYKLFLKKVPNDPDKKKFEKYIKDNPETPPTN
jgi:predicted Zn-dependent protease